MELFRIMLRMPDGTYEGFRPQEDITAWELALCVNVLLEATMHSSAAIEGLNALRPEARRHFTHVEKRR